MSMTADSRLVYPSTELLESWWYHQPMRFPIFSPNHHSLGTMARDSVAGGTSVFNPAGERNSRHICAEITPGKPFWNLPQSRKPDLLREVIDASTAEEGPPPPPAHMLVRFNRRGLKRAYGDAQLYWEEKARTACNRNISSIHNLVKLYGVKIDDLPRIAAAKYGVQYFCPDDGDYSFDVELNQVLCSVHGNREHSRQNPLPDRKASFARFVENLDEITAFLRFQDDALLTTVEIVRSAKGKK